MLVLGLDIGSLYIKVALCEITDEENGKEKNTRVVYTTKESNKGSKCGIIIDLEKTKKTLKTILDRVNEKIDIYNLKNKDEDENDESEYKISEIEHYIINLSGNVINSYTGTSTIPLWKKDGEDRRVKVTKKNIKEVIESAKMSYSIDNKKVIHIVPQEYKVDDNEYTFNPISMTGVKLKGNVLFIQSEKNQLENLDNILNECNIHDYNIVYSPIASAEAILDDEDKDSGVIVVMMGGETTELVVYQNSVLRMAKVIPLGSDYITRDIRYVLKVDYAASETLKKNKGDAFFEEGVSIDEKISLAKIGNLQSDIDNTEKELFTDNIDDNNIDTSHLSKIIASRLEEIYQKVLEEIYEGDFQRKVHTPIVLESEAIKLKGADKLFKDMINSSISRRRITGIEDVTAERNNPSFITAIGLVKYGAKNNYFNFNNKNEEDYFEEDDENDESKSIFSKLKGFFADLV